MRPLLLATRLVLPVQHIRLGVRCYSGLPRIKWQPSLSQNNHQHNPKLKCYVPTQSFATSTTLLKAKGGKVRPKTPAQKVDYKVYLLNEDSDVIGVVPLSEAEKIAESSHRKLVKIQVVPDDLNGVTQDAGGQNIYQLMTAKQLTEERKRLREVKKSKPKGAKVMRMSSKIATHDLETKMKHVLDLLQKGHNVNIFLREDRPSSATTKLAELFKHISNAVSEAATVKHAKRAVQGKGGNWEEEDDAHAAEMEIRLTPILTGNDGDQEEKIKPLSHRELVQNTKSKDDS